MMWVILIDSIDTGIAISGANYYDALIAAIDMVAEELGVIDNDLVDVALLQWV